MTTAIIELKTIRTKIGSLKPIQIIILSLTKKKLENMHLLISPLHLISEALNGSTGMFPSNPWPMNTVFFHACLHMYISTLHNCMTQCTDRQLAFTFSFVFVSLVIVQKISVVVRLLPHTKKAVGSIPLEACLKLVCSLHVQVSPS